MIDEPQYGQIKAALKTWDSGEENVSKFDSLPIRPCSERELGRGPTKFKDSLAKFYPSYSSTERWMNKYWRKLNCVDSEITLKGNYQSFSASHFQIQFEKCNNSTRIDGEFCKSDEEITEWLQRKFIIVLNNSHRFNEEDYT